MSNRLFRVNSERQLVQFKSMRRKFYKQSTEKFVSRIDPDAFSASG